jgi:hypothetical protein
MQINEQPEEYADIKKRPAMTRAMAQRIAAAYKKKKDEGRAMKPMTTFLAQIRLAAVTTEDR